MAEWSTLALYWYAPTAASTVDPIFGRPLTFYFFTLPAWQLLTGWLLTLAVMAGGIALAFIAITGGGRILVGRDSSRAAGAWRGLSISVRGGAADARRARVPRPVRAVVRGSHDFFRRRLHRCARHAHGHARGRGGTRRRRGDSARERRVGAAGTLARPRDRACVRVLRRGRSCGRVRRQLHRETEPARARAALHHEQHHS